MDNKQLTKRLIGSGLAVKVDDNLLVNEDFLSALDKRIGLRIAEELGEDKIGQFNQLGDDDDSRLNWVKQQLPNLDQLVQSEADALVGDINSDTDEIMKML